MSERAATNQGTRTGRGNALRSFLDSLRRTPAVPGAVGDELAGELAPLFALLDGIEAEAAAARSAAALHAQTEATDAAEEVETILSFAHGKADAERDEVVKAAHRAADVEVHRVLEEGAAEARRIRRLDPDRRDALAEEVVRRVLAFPREQR